MGHPKLTALPPKPTTHVDPEVEKEAENKKYDLLTLAKKWLRWSQKWSLVPLVTFIPLHAVNVLIIPALEPSSAPNDALMMIRELTSGIGTRIMWGGICAHVASGLLLRAVRLFRGTSRHHSKDLSIITGESVAQSKIGLVGGLSGYFLGIKKNVRFNPQEISGWLLTPVLLLHATLMKWIPEEKNITIDFDFIKWLLSKDRNPFVRYGLGYGPLAAVIGLGSYHMIAGMVQYLRIRSLKTRKKTVNLVVLLCVSGMIGLSRMSSQIVTGMDQYYQPIIKAFIK